MKIKYYWNISTRIADKKAVREHLLAMRPKAAMSVPTPRIAALSGIADKKGKFRIAALSGIADS